VLEKHWDDNAMAQFRLNAGWFLTRAGKLEAAQPLLLAVLDEQISSLGMAHGKVAVTRIILARWYIKVGEAEKAREQLDLARTASSELALPQKAAMERHDALLHALEGRREEALRGLEHAEDLDRQLRGERDPRYLLGRLDRAELLARGTAEQKAAGAALAAEILREVEPLLVPDAPVLERLRKLLH
jgi:tetratricopeptide (TPR) repeat protein